MMIRVPFYRPEVPSHLEMHVVSIGMADRTSFDPSLPEHAEKLARHPDNQDAYIVTRSGLFIADGMTLSAEDEYGESMPGGGGGEAAQAVVEEFSSYLDDAGVSQLSPRKARRAVGEAAAHTDDVLARRKQAGEVIGKTTLVAVIATGRPGEFLLYNAGDSRGQHNRGPQVLFQTVEQSTPQGGGGITNCFDTRGKGRTSMEEARDIVRNARRYGTLISTDLLVDQVVQVHAKVGDRFVLYTDGLEGAADGKDIDARMIAEETAHHKTPREAAEALSTLPEDLRARAKDPGSVWVKADDLTVGVAEVVAD